MYQEHERPSTKRMLVTAASVVGVIALAVLALSVGLRAAAPTYTASPAPEPMRPAGSATVAPAPSVAAAPKKAEVVTPVVPIAPVIPKASAAKSKPAAQPSPMSSLGTVVIDAGHQAQGDSSLEPIGPGSGTEKAKVAGGATGVSTHNPESLVNLQVALKLQKVLEAQGVKVIQVRTKEDVNISNSERAAIANKAGAALFIRLHCDGIDGSSSTNGLSTLVPGKNQWTGPIVAESTKAGKLVHAAAISGTGANDRGVVTRADLSGFNWSKVPTVLVEMGFMSNPAEDQKLGSSAYQQKLADGMANGIVEYLKTR